MSVDSLPSGLLNKRRHYAYLLILTFGFLVLAGCSDSNLIAHGTNTSTALPSSKPLSISETLRGDPRFTDFVRVIDFAGLGHNLNKAQNITVFAPTNYAFEHSDPGWTEYSVPDEMSNGGASAQARQTLIRQSGLAGIHPESDFAGKLQDVRSIGGRVFHIDERVDGTMTITTDPAPDTGINFRTPTVRVARVTLPPITATDGLIYPVDAIIVR